MLAAIGAAESRPPVLSVPYFHEDAAVPAVEAVLYGLGLHVLGMLPVQPLAMGRAEFSPLIRPLRHDDPLAAADAAKGAQHLSSGSLRRRRFVPMAVGVAPAGRTAVPLRRAVRRKDLAADRAFRFPFHCSLDLPVHAKVELVRVFIVVADGFFHVQVHIGALAELVGEAEADVVPRALVFIGRAEEACGVAGFNVLIAEEFMEHVGLDVEGALFADVLTEAETDAANQAVDSIELDVRILARRVVSIGDVSVLDLSLKLDVPVVAQVFLAAVFGTGRVHEVAVIADNFFAESSRVQLEIVGQSAELQDVVRVMAFIAQPRVIEPDAAAAYVAFTGYVLVVRRAAHVVNRHALTMFAVFTVVHPRIVA